jgi:cytochrome c
MRVSAALVLFASALLAMSCDLAAAGDNNKAGVAAFRKYGCGSCHTISGVSGANGLVGPPLTGIGNRRYIAGELANTHDNLMHWIQHPQSVNPRTAMPELGVTPQDANDIAALLYTSK